jgi:hypothetical protein
MKSLMFNHSCVIAVACCLFNISVDVPQQSHWRDYSVLRAYHTVCIIKYAILLLTGMESTKRCDDTLI